MADIAEDAMSEEREVNQRNIDEFRANGEKVGGQFDGRNYSK